MRQNDKSDRRNPDRGIGAGNAALTEKQRDTEQDVPHMPRHWQEHGGRGEAPGQGVPKPDDRAPARGNQYGAAGRISESQQRESLTEHGRQPSPQTRDNQQLPKRPGERSEDLPTPHEDE